jgi:hypothetical protein
VLWDFRFSATLYFVASGPVTDSAFRHRYVSKLLHDPLRTLKFGDHLQIICAELFYISNLFPQRWQLIGKGLRGYKLFR